MELKDRLKRARKNANLTQDEVVQRIDGLTQSAYSQLESGKVKSSSKIVELANLFKVNPTWLATGQDSVIYNNSVQIDTQHNLTHPNLTHLDTDGNITMVDVGDKSVTQRSATAQGKVIFPPQVYTAIKSSDGQTKKGSITATAHIAGIMAAKKTHELIPLCHALPLDTVKMSFDYDDTTHAIHVTATAKVTHKTGVEMEALTAVSVACLTIYDMTKAISHDIVISDICLVNKTGGKSDYVK